MGVIMSTISVLNLCVNRLVTWGCCVVLISGFMMVMFITIIYGITIGYHTAQEELVSFAIKSGDIKKTLRSGDEKLLEDADQIQEEVTCENDDACTKNVTKTTTPSVLEFYDSKPPNSTSNDTNLTPIFIVFTESPRDRPVPDPTPKEENDPAQMRGRQRRSKQDVFNNLKFSSFWRPWKAEKEDKG